LAASGNICRRAVVNNGNYAMMTNGTFFVANIKESASSRLNTSGVA
jgi:hypothetical protein